MSKKNIWNHRREPYPVVERTVIYNRKRHRHNMPVPEVGKKYHCFDDGKIRFSRHYIVEVSEVIGYCAFKKKYPVLFKNYTSLVKRCYWLYAKSTDFFVVCEKGENGELAVFVRMKDGGWFSIGDFINSGELDVTGELWNDLVAHIDNFDYSAEEKKQIIKEGTI